MFEGAVKVCSAVAGHIAEFVDCTTVSECEGLYDYITEYLQREYDDGVIKGATVDLWSFRALIAFHRRVETIERSVLIVDKKRGGRV